jgi:hypothetical protein
MKKACCFVVLAMLVIGFCAAQSANDAQRLVGTWVSVDGIQTYVFNANGTGTYTAGGETSNIFWGVSFSGQLCTYSDRLEREATFFLSPDGRRMIWGRAYQKR